MSKRSERREAERAARKAAYKKLRQQRSQFAGLGVIPAESPQSETNEPLLAPAEELPQIYCEIAAPPIEANLKSESEPEPVAKPISDAQLAANRVNAQLSTGPATPEGRARSSMNALKHGLTGKTVLLPHEDAAQYLHQLDSFVSVHKPATEQELCLVQSIVDCLWRLDRIVHLEAAILLKGQLECASQFEDPKYKDRTPFERGHLINAEAYLKYERQLRNLNIQEARLRRTMEKENRELARLQAIRRHQEQFELKMQPKTQTAAAQSANGFDFARQPTPQPDRNRPAQRSPKLAA